MAAAKLLVTRRWRRYLQLRLRTFFALTLVASLGCVWWLLPEKRDREFAEGALKLRSHGRMMLAVDAFTATAPPGAPAGAKPLVPKWTEQGLWELRDREEHVLCRGRKLNDAAAGRWTWYFPSGRRAATGICDNDLPSATWTTWHPNGQKESQVSFALNGSKTKAVRSGPATWWRSDGTVRLQGEFTDDERTGQWTEFSAAGEKISAGEYRQGMRSGSWTFYPESGSAPPRRVHYHAGEVISPSEELPGLAAELASGDLRRQHVAARRLAMLGQAAVPTLLAELKSPDRTRRILALEGFVWLEPPVSLDAPELTVLATSNQSEERWLARMVLARGEAEQGAPLASEIWNDWEQRYDANPPASTGRAVVWLGKPAVKVLRERLESEEATGPLLTLKATIVLSKTGELWEEMSRPPGALRLEQLEAIIADLPERLQRPAREFSEDYDRKHPSTRGGSFSAIPVVGYSGLPANHGFSSGVAGNGLFGR